MKKKIVIYFVIFLAIVSVLCLDERCPKYAAELYLRYYFLIKNGNQADIKNYRIYRPSGWTIIKSEEDSIHFAKHFVTGSKNIAERKNGYIGVAVGIVIMQDIIKNTKLYSRIDVESKSYEIRTLNFTEIDFGFYVPIKDNLAIVFGDKNNISYLPEFISGVNIEILESR